MWSIPGDIVPRHLVGAVSCVMNGVGVAVGFVGPLLVGYVRALPSSFSSWLAAMGACLLLAGAGGASRRCGRLADLRTSEH